MISKELLTEVLREKRVILDYEISIDETEIHYGHKDIDEDGFINIYELAHLCKEWLENNTHWDVMIIEYEVYLMEDIWGDDGAVTHKRFTREREWYLNLFKACEYILEQKGNK